MKTTLIPSLLICLLSFHINSVEAQEEHDVVAVYEKIDLDYGTLDENGEEISFILVKTNLKNGMYSIEIGDKINSTIYGVRGSDLYLEFRYSPYLYRFDEGVLEWSYGSGTFYEEED